MRGADPQMSVDSSKPDIRMSVRKCGRTADHGRDGMDTALASGTQGPADVRRSSRTDRHQCARVAFRHVQL